MITLDLISKGRVILGVGIGYQAADFQAFAVPMEHRVALFEEGVEIVRKCWSGEPFTFHGAHYHLDNVCIYPRPYQSPAAPCPLGRTSTCEDLASSQAVRGTRLAILSLSRAE